ncbi:MAG: adenylyl-sulfate kinase [Bradymonadia bacterium]|jgi:adenylyl-sulfate kinase
MTTRMNPTRDPNVIWQPTAVQRQNREQRLGQRARLLWFTGLSGSGKSTLAVALEERLHQQGFATYLLDGDNVRHGLNAGLGFSAEDRTENLRRIREVGKLMVDAGLIVLASFVSPYRSDREAVREAMGEDFAEVYVSTPLEVCEARDVKGLYAKARAGEIPHFTGISAPYEAPENAEAVLDTTTLALDDAVDQLIETLQLIRAS